MRLFRGKRNEQYYLRTVQNLAQDAWQDGYDDVSNELAGIVIRLAARRARANDSLWNGDRPEVRPRIQLEKA